MTIIVTFYTDEIYVYIKSLLTKKRKKCNSFRGQWPGQLYLRQIPSEPALSHTQLIQYASPHYIYIHHLFHPNCIEIGRVINVVTISIGINFDLMLIMDNITWLRERVAHFL